MVPGLPNYGLAKGYLPVGNYKQALKYMQLAKEKFLLETP